MVEAYFEMGAPSPDIRGRFDVDIREFVVLACIYEFRRAKKTQIQRAVGLSSRTIAANLSVLVDNGLIRTNGVSVDEYVPTFEGIALVRRRTESN